MKHATLLVAFFDAKMSGDAFGTSRQLGHALIVGSPACRSTPLRILQSLGYQCSEVEDPYAAMLEVCRRPLVYRSLVLSLASLYREELQMITTIRSRYAHVEIFVAQTDGRQAALAEAMRLGVQGLIADDGLHRIDGAMPAETLAPAPSVPAFPIQSGAATGEKAEGEIGVPEAVLSAEELRALLADQPSYPPAEEG